MVEERTELASRTPRKWHDFPMNDRGVFVFAEDGVQFFRTIALAAGYVEAVDAEEGVYEDFITLDGERLVPRALDATNVRLERSGEDAGERLLELLQRESSTRHSWTSDPTDPVSVANELLTFQWESRWPKWPGWLDRRLHGAKPARISRA